VAGRREYVFFAALTPPICRDTIEISEISIGGRRGVSGKTLSCKGKEMRMAKAKAAQPEKTVPVSIRSRYPSQGHGVAFVAVGSKIELAGDHGYWMVVVDLLTAKISKSGIAQSNSKIPDFIKPYVGNPDYALFVATSYVGTDSLPQGELATFLRKTGSGRVLRALEQFVSQQYKSGEYAGFSYVLAATLDAGDAPGFEEGSFYHDSWMTVELLETKVAGKTRYILIRH